MNDKKYTAKEAALAVLKKAHDMLLAKSEGHGEKLAHQEKDQTPADDVQQVNPDAQHAEGNEPSLGEKVNAVVEAHLAEHGEGEKAEEKEENLKGHMKLAKFIGRMEAKREGKAEGSEHPKSEGETAELAKKETGHEKGVHTHNHEGLGRSAAGSYASSAVKGNTSIPKNTLNSYAKDEHKERLGELKSMKKPNLTKKVDSDFDHGQKKGPQGYPKYQEQAQNEKGVNTPVSGVTQFPGGKGTSKAGDFVKDRYAGKPTFSGKDHPAIAEHKKVLSEMKAMPKPNLTKKAAK